MGKGDKKTKKGKISMGSYGNSRPRTVAKSAAAPKKDKAEAAPKAEKKAPAKKAAAKKA